MNWQALASIATLIAVVVALLPIWREAGRTKAMARSLRLRLSSKLLILRPSIQSKIHNKPVRYESAVLRQNEFKNIIQQTSALLIESYVLNTDEQDQIGIMLSNLEIASMLYGTESFQPDIAENILQLIYRSIELMSEYGYLEGNIIKPWDSK